MSMYMSQSTNPLLVVDWIPTAYWDGLLLSLFIFAMPETRGSAPLRARA